jgi:hypothetical protein
VSRHQPNKNTDHIFEDNSVDNTTYKPQMTTDNNSEKNNATLQ